MNRLAREPSPYLRQHADNPVDWYPWGDEALERARREDRPILLSVGYSACHWCHVMAHESFEDETTARLMNELFVNVKLDREERPDLDQLYQGVVQLMGRGGGWPLTVFLTPELRPFYGGTYFPRSARHGLPGFGDLLQALADAWRTRRSEVEEQAREFERGLAYVARQGLEGQPGALRAADIVSAADALEAEVDRVHGGFGGAPKFPNPMNLALLLRGFRRSRRPELLSAATLTLERMATSGTCDQLGGGFHRYSVDARWEVPHFEKMLYDNAQLLHLYAETQQLEPSSLWEKVGRETVAWLEREMTSPEGAFYATQDADSEGEEGKFFVWTPAEVDAALPPRLADLARRWFGITPMGNFEDGRTVLQTRLSAEALARELGRDEASLRGDLDEARRLLFETREKRVRPGLDDKVLAGWNGLMIRGLALASRAFGEPGWAVNASRAADFILSKLWNGERLRRSWQGGEARIDAFIEDYGDLASGLAALFQATFEPRHLEAAEAIARRAVELFWDDAAGAYHSAPKGQKDLFCATYALHDNAFPSGASTLTEAQVALAALTGNPDHLEQAGRYLSRMRQAMTQNPFAYGHLLLAADAYVDGAAEVTLIGPRAALRPFVEVVNRTYAPTMAVFAHDPSTSPPPLLAGVLAGRAADEGQARAYVCRNFSCEPPVSDPAALARSLVSSPTPSVGPSSLLR
jgi:uncharacterized protein YyaL (SSP411 family)